MVLVWYIVVHLSHPLLNNNVLCIHAADYCHAYHKSYILLVKNSSETWILTVDIYNLHCAREIQLGRPGGKLALCLVHSNLFVIVETSNLYSPMAAKSSELVTLCNVMLFFYWRHTENSSTSRGEYLLYGKIVIVHPCTWQPNSYNHYLSST